MQTRMPSTIQFAAFLDLITFTIDDLPRLRFFAGSAFGGGLRHDRDMRRCKLTSSRGRS